MSPGLLSRRKGSSTDTDLAERVFLTLLSQPRWITRTVETVAFVDRQTVRRRISRHFIVPDKAIRPEIATGVLLPVLGVPKGQFISCDLKDESNHAVSVPALPGRAHLSADALCVLAEYLLGGVDSTMRELITELVTAGPESSQAKLEAARDRAMKSLFADPHFRLLATYLAHNYLVFVDVALPTDGEPARHIVRFELDSMIRPQVEDELRELRASRRYGRPGIYWRPRHRGWDRRPRALIRTILRSLGLRGNPFTHIVPIDGAGSYHLDVEAAEGVAFGERHLRFYPGRGTFLDVQHPGASSRRARLLIPRTLGRGSAAMTINIRAASGLLRDTAPPLLIGFAAMLYGVYCNFETLQGAELAPVPLLLVIPGLVSVITARPGEHPYVSSVLFYIRVLAVVPLPLGLIAAYDLIVEGSPWIIRDCAALALFFGLVLLVGRLLDARKIRPRLTEWVADDLTRVG